MAGCCKIIDLFCGAGGLSLGAHRAGFITALAVDVDSTLTSSFAENFPGSNLLVQDISRVSGQKLVETAGLNDGEAFGLVGGPPCQGFSLMGRRDANDPRNSLIGHFFRIVHETKPAFFMMENVPGLLLGDARKFLDDATSDLKGYNVLGPIRVDASDFGAATKRERVIVVGIRDGKVTASDLDMQKVRDKATVRSAIADLPEPAPSGWAAYPKEQQISEYAARARLIDPSLGAAAFREKMRVGKVSGLQPTKHSKDVRKRFSKVAPGKSDEISRCPRLDWDRLSPTLRAGTGPDHGSFQSIRPIHPARDRVITVREAARLQGFPDWFKFHETKWHSFRMIGNSVSPLVSEALLKTVAAGS